MSKPNQSKVIQYSAASIAIGTGLIPLFLGLRLLFGDLSNWFFAVPIGWFGGVAIWFGVNLIKELTRTNLNRCAAMTVAFCSIYLMSLAIDYLDLSNDSKGVYRELLVFTATILAISAHVILMKRLAPRCRFQAPRIGDIVSHGIVVIVSFILWTLLNKLVATYWLSEGESQNPAEWILPLIFAIFFYFRAKTWLNERKENLDDIDFTTQQG